MYFFNFPVCDDGGEPGFDTPFRFRIDDLARVRTYAPNFESARRVPLSSASRTARSSKNTKLLATRSSSNVFDDKRIGEDVSFFQLLFVEEGVIIDGRDVVVGSAVRDIAVGEIERDRTR